MAGVVGALISGRSVVRMLDTMLDVFSVGLAVTAFELSPFFVDVGTEFETGDVELAPLLVTAGTEVSVVDVEIVVWVDGPYMVDTLSESWYAKAVVLEVGPLPLALFATVVVMMVVGMVVEDSEGYVVAYCDESIVADAYVSVAYVKVRLP